VDTISIETTLKVERLVSVDLLSRRMKRIRLRFFYLTRNDLFGLKKINKCGQNI